jgi:hypothetical protein
MNEIRTGWPSEYSLFCLRQRLFSPASTWDLGSTQSPTPWTPPEPLSQGLKQPGVRLSIYFPLAPMLNLSGLLSLLCHRSSRSGSWLRIAIIFLTIIQEAQIKPLTMVSESHNSIIVFPGLSYMNTPHIFLFYVPFSIIFYCIFIITINFLPLYALPVYPNFTQVWNLVSIPLGEEHRLKAFPNWNLSRLLRHEWEWIKGGWRKINNYELHNVN